MSTPTPRRARTRTGCKTCRQRKLKCDEVKPVCGHCRKSNRECQPSEGISFRHAQNAGLNEQAGGEELGNFYKYRQKFKDTYFLPIPQELSFVHVTDPYADETVASPSQPQQSLQYSSSTQYQHPQYVDVAATSLKAMIDPNLEAGTDPEHGALHHGHEDSVGINELTEAESLNETILNALKQSSAEMQKLQ